MRLGGLRSILTAVIVGGGVLIGAGAMPTAATPADPLGCADRVFDPEGIASPALTATADRVAEVLDADLHVRIEGILDGDLDGRQALLEQRCGWTGPGGVRNDDLLVVMVSPEERQTSIYYGADYSVALISADPQIQQYVMNPRFKEGDYETGLDDGLEAIRVAVRGGGVPQAPDVSGPNLSSSSSSSRSDDGSDFPVVGIVALIALVVLVSIGGWWSEKNGWTTSSSTSGYRRSWSSSSSSRRSSSSSRRSSSSGRSSSRRSGGGGSSSRW